MEIITEKQGQYSDGSWDYSVTFVLDYATVTVSVCDDEDIDGDEFDGIDDDRIVDIARGILAYHHGIMLD